MNRTITPNRNSDFKLPNGGAMYLSTSQLSWQLPSPLNDLHCATQSTRLRGELQKDRTAMMIVARPMKIATIRISLMFPAIAT